MDFFQSIYNWWWWWSADTMRYLMFPHFNVFKRSSSAVIDHSWVLERLTCDEVSVNIPGLYIYILYVFPSLCSLKAKCFHIHWYWTLTSGSLLVLSCLCWQDTEGADLNPECYRQMLKLFYMLWTIKTVFFIPLSWQRNNMQLMLSGFLSWTAQFTCISARRPDTSCLCCVLSVDCLIIKLI